MSDQTRPHALAFIFVTVLIDTIGFGIILPVTPQLIMDLTGLGIGEASLRGGWRSSGLTAAAPAPSRVVGVIDAGKVRDRGRLRGRRHHRPGAGYQQGCATNRVRQQFVLPASPFSVRVHVRCLVQCSKFAVARFGTTSSARSSEPEPRTPNLEPRTEPEHEPGSENPEA